MEWPYGYVMVETTRMDLPEEDLCANFTLILVTLGLIVLTFVLAGGGQK